MSDAPVPADPIEQFLNTPAPLAGDDRLRQTLLLRTTQLLRRRRRLKRLGLAAALAACYLAGLATVRFFTPPAADTGVPPAGDPRQAEQPRPPAPPPPASAPREQDADAPAVVLEWRA